MLQLQVFVPFKKKVRGDQYVLFIRFYKIVSGVMLHISSVNAEHLQLKVIFLNEGRMFSLLCNGFKAKNHIKK